MDDLIDLSVQFENDIAEYERLLKQVQRTANLPAPDGYTKLETVVIERIICDLKTLLAATTK